MYHSRKSLRRRRKRRALKCAVLVSAVCFFLAVGYLLLPQEAPGDLTAQWLIPMVPGGSCTRQEIYTVVLPAQTVYCPDRSLPLGQEKLLQEGTDGELRCTDLVAYRDGLETDRAAVSKELLRQPETRIVALGEQTKPVPEIQNGSIRLPDGQTLSYTHARTIRAGAYPQSAGCFPLTGTDGTQSRIGLAAADPARIPPGTRMYIAASDGSLFYGIARAVDGGRTGDQIELYFPTTAECLEFGERECTVYFLG